MFTGLSKTQINSLDRQNDWGIKTAFFRKKPERLSDLKTKPKIMTFEGHLKFSCLNYLSRLLKGQIASFNNSFMFPNTQLKYNTKTLKLSSQIHTDWAVIRNSFVSFTRKKWSQLSRNERKQILETKQHRRIRKQLSLCSYNICEIPEEPLEILPLKLQKMSALTEKKKHEPNLFIIQK